MQCKNLTFIPGAFCDIRGEYCNPEKYNCNPGIIPEGLIKRFNLNVQDFIIKNNIQE